MTPMTCLSYSAILRVTCGCGHWPVTFLLTVFENRMPKRILGLKREEVTGGWRKLYNEELYGLLCSPDVKVIL